MTRYFDDTPERIVDRSANDVVAPASGTDYGLRALSTLAKIATDGSFWRGAATRAVWNQKGAIQGRFPLALRGTIAAASALALIAAAMSLTFAEPRLSGHAFFATVAGMGVLEAALLVLIERIV